jgi:hypothetical protein
MAVAEVSMATVLSESVTGQEQAGPDNQPLFDCSFQSKWGSTTITNGCEASGQHISTGIGDTECSHYLLGSEHLSKIALTRCSAQVNVAVDEAGKEVFTIEIDDLTIFGGRLELS